MAPEAAAAERDASLEIREAVPAEYEAIGELTVRAYATVGDPLLGSRANTDYEHELRDVAGRAPSIRGRQ